MVPYGELVVVGSLLCRLAPPTGQLLPRVPGLHGLLAQWIEMERKARAATEEERNAYGTRMAELHQEMERDLSPGYERHGIVAAMSANAPTVRSLDHLSSVDADDVVLQLDQVPAHDGAAQDLRRVVQLYIPGGAAWLIAACPRLRGIAITAPTPGDLDAIAKLPALDRLSIRYETTGAQLRDLFDAMESATLSALTLMDLPLRDKGAIALAAHPRLARLDTLSLSSTGVGAKGAAAFAEHLTALENLDLSYGSVGAAGFAALCSGALPRLRRLCLYSQKIGDEPIARLGGAGFTSTLESLNLGKNGLSAAGVGALARTELPRLRSLLLHGNLLGDDAVVALEGAPWLQQLERLALSGRALTVTGHARRARAARSSLSSWQQRGHAPRRCRGAGIAAACHSMSGR